MKKLTKSRLAILLSTMEDFENHDLKLEQYSTPSEIAAEMLWQVALEGNLDGKTVLDAACGPGFFGLGALLLGAKKVILVDKSEEAISIAKRNYKRLSERYEVGEAEFLNIDIREFNGKADTVVENPPFGTVDKHIDKVFLEKAFASADVVYSIHKITSKAFIQALADDHGFEVVSVQELDFPIKNTMKHHTKPVKIIKTGLWKLQRKP